MQDSKFKKFLHSHKFRSRGKALSYFFLFLSIFLVVLTLFFGVGIYKQIHEISPEGKEVSISGEGEVFAEPDLGKINFSVKTERDEVSKAMEENTKKMNSVIEAIKNQGIKEKDLKTTNFSLSPRYEWRDETEKDKDGKRILAGYEVEQTLRVKIRKLEKIGKVVEKATAAGANKVSNLSLTIENPEKLKEKAREEAIKEAKDKAENISSQLEVKLKKIVDFSESFGPVPRSSYAFKEMEMVGSGASPQIEAGENKISAQVSITYKIE